MKPFIVPIILWTYLLAVVLAKGFWVRIYDRLIVALDVSPSQSWILPICLNLLAAVIGLPRILSFITAVRRRDTMPASRYIGSALCIAAMLLCVWAAVFGGYRVRQQLVSGASEWIGGEEEEIFAAGQMVNGWYSNHVVGVVMQLPGDWHQMSLNAMRRAKHSGASAVSRGDTRWAEELAAKRNGVYSLLAVRRHPDSFSGYNPSLAFTAYSKEALAATGVHSLRAYVNSFTEMTDPYYVRSGPSREQFGSENGYHIHVEAHFPGSVLHQHVFVLETARFYLVVTASIIDEADLSVMRQSISTVRVIKR